MLYLALDMGLTAEEYWDMSPRAVCLLLEERRKMASGGGSGRRTNNIDEPTDRSGLKRLNFIPRP